jgi:hypothetical protein
MTPTLPVAIVLLVVVQSCTGASFNQVVMRTLLAVPESLIFNLTH